ncbi:MAG: hypothetical protein HWE30_00585 [Methylocystaceae bacterium]|nr:hypothetical protein [Methylocystaceae bacterium]
MKITWKIFGIFSSLLLLSACSSKLDYYSGSVIEDYRSRIIEQCIINVKGPQGQVVRSYQCNENCSVWISGLYKGPDQWRRISFTLFARANTPVHQNTYGSIYHNLENDETICGPNNFVEKYPDIDWLQYNKYMPDQTDPQRSNVYPVSEEEWRK